MTSSSSPSTPGEPTEPSTPDVGWMPGEHTPASPGEGTRQRPGGWVEPDEWVDQAYVDALAEALQAEADAAPGHPHIAAMANVCEFAADLIKFRTEPASPAPPAPLTRRLILDDGEVTLTPEGDGFVLTVQINEEGDAVSHRLTADEVRSLAAPLTPTPPEAFVSIEATSLTEWADLRDAVAHADGLTPGEVMASDTHPLAPVAAAARAFLAACTHPLTPTPQPDGETVGWMVLTADGLGGWDADWDGLVHTDRPDADHALEAASVEWGAVLVELRRVTDRSDAAAPPSTPVERPQPDGLEELRKLSEAATAGPWAVEHRHCDATDEDDEMSGLGWEFVHNQGPPEPQLRGMFAKAADAHLIVQAVAYVRAVLATPPVPGDNP